jgi:nucleoside 2-deoxyribosyltransferase
MKEKPQQRQILTIYLAGPMEYTLDNGLDWRLEYRDILAEFGVKCIIPNHEEAELIPDVEAFTKLKKDNYPEYKAVMRDIAEKDITFVWDADFIICKWEGERMSGSIGEMHEAFFHAGTPCYLITTQPLHTVPGWFGCCFEKEFRTIEEFIKFKWGK